jgi:Kef-type K+ transport system membrane component KefB/predicted transcriptional regulator
MIMQSILLVSNSNLSHHLDLLLILGIAIFGGTIGARIFQKLRIPQVVGYIVIGILIGGSAFNLLDQQLVRSFLPFNLFALGIIGFMIGGELKYDLFKKYGKQFIIILFAEGLFAFLIVTVLTTFVGALFTGNWYSSLAFGLVLGAISSATAPAATVDVLWEYKTRGILTRTILAIVALDDGLALLLYGFASSISARLVGITESGLLKSLFLPIWEMSGGIGVGLLIGLLLIFVLKYTNDQSKILAFSIASILLVIGVSMTLKVESILAAMVFGAVLANFRPRRSKAVFDLVQSFSTPVYVLFFVLAGARLQMANIPMWVLFIALVYVIGRSLGKITGSWFGAYISNSSSTVRKYLGICLFSQAGVAIGLSILAGEQLGGSFGEAIILIITSTTFLVQIIGPPLVKVGVKKAGEVGLNVTEQDLIQSYHIKDVIDTKVPIISTGMSLRELVTLVGGTDSFYYPVVNDSKQLIGAITLNGIKNTFATQELNDWLVALDIMEPVIAKMTPDIPLSEALENANRLYTEYVPIVASQQDDKFVGLLDCRAVHRQLSAEVLSRQQKADNITVG